MQSSFTLPFAALGSSIAVSYTHLGLEIGHQSAGQPHQFDVALCFTLQSATRLDTVEISVDVQLE